MAESKGYHEATELLRPATIEMHRAITSLCEELEAVDWYMQRIDASQDEELARVLAHNRDEEKEHAAMVLEWLRRRDAILDEQLRKYLFTEGSIEDRAEEEETHAPAGDGGGSLGIGDLREART